MQLRVRALETVLTEKGYIDPGALDALIEAYETKVGPHRGARVVAKAWADPEFKRALLADGYHDHSRRRSVRARQATISSRSPTPNGHNMVVCTLCSCYPWDMLGLPPVWYKSAPYRSRAVSDPRGVLRDFGVQLPEYDRDPGVGLDRRDTLPGAADAPRRHRRLERGQARQARHPQRDDRHRPAARSGQAAMNGVHDMGGMHGFGKVSEEPNEPVFHADWEGRAFAMSMVMRTIGLWNIDMSRAARDAAGARLSGELLLPKLGPRARATGARAWAGQHGGDRGWPRARPGKPLGSNLSRPMSAACSPAGRTNGRRPRQLASSPATGYARATSTR